MDVWTDNFLWIAVCIALLGWIIAGKAWSRNFSTMKNLVVCIILSASFLSLVGCIAAIASHMSSIGAKPVYQALISDFLGGSTYFFEVSFETTAVWGPVILTKVGILVVRDLKRRTSES